MKCRKFCGWDILDNLVYLFNTFLTVICTIHNRNRHKSCLLQHKTITKLLFVIAFTFFINFLVTFYQNMQRDLCTVIEKYISFDTDCTLFSAAHVSNHCPDSLLPHSAPSVALKLNQMWLHNQAWAKWPLSALKSLISPQTKHLGGMSAISHCS